jgi:hypothetical protein
MKRCRRYLPDDELKKYEKELRLVYNKCTLCQELLRCKRRESRVGLGLQLSKKEVK